MTIIRATDPGNTGRWLQDIDMTGKPMELLLLFIQYNRKQMTNVKKGSLVCTKRSTRFCLKWRNQPHLFTFIIASKYYHANRVKAILFSQISLVWTAHVSIKFTQCLQNNSRTLTPTLLHLPFNPPLYSHFWIPTFPAADYRNWHRESPPLPTLQHKSLTSSEIVTLSGLIKHVYTPHTAPVRWHKCTFQRLLL